MQGTIPYGQNIYNILYHKYIIYNIVYYVNMLYNVNINNLAPRKDTFLLSGVSFFGKLNI